MDEFHIGGRQATNLLLASMPPIQGGQVLDIGCGIGGPARFFATQLDCNVTGIDLTADYVDAGNMMSEWVGLSDRVSLQHGNATKMPFADAQFDAAYMMHVGMNIKDKDSLFENAFRVLRPGGCFAIYDVMRVGDAAISYPLPWAETSNMDAVSAPQTYRNALRKAGFTIDSKIDRSEMAITFFEKMATAAKKSTGLPPIGLHILMGPTTPQKIGNIARHIRDGLLAPIEIMAKKPDKE